jgi:GNAT superfamily N-acetyltransferase
LKWEEVVKMSRKLYHPISIDFDGFFEEVRFEDEDGHDMGEDMIMHLRFRDWETVERFGIVLYEVHIGMHPKLQGKGNAEKMIVGAVLDRNEILGKIPLYLNYHRIINPRVMSVVEKLKNNPMIETKEIKMDGEPAGLLMSTNYEVMGE